MKFRLEEIEVPEDEPFKYDTLKRQPVVEFVRDLIKQLEGPFVLALDSPWGTGKTTVVRMLLTRGMERFKLDDQLAQQLGGVVARGGRGEYGRATLTRNSVTSKLLGDSTPQVHDVWMSHFDAVVRPPEGFRAVASTPDAPVAALEHAGLDEIKLTTFGTTLSKIMRPGVRIEADGEDLAAIRASVPPGFAADLDALLAEKGWFQSRKTALANALRALAACLEDETAELKDSAIKNLREFDLDGQLLPERVAAFAAHPLVQAARGFFGLESARAIRAGHGRSRRPGPPSRRGA